MSVIYSLHHSGSYQGLEVFVISANDNRTGWTSLLPIPELPSMVALNLPKRIPQGVQIPGYQGGYYVSPEGGLVLDHIKWSEVDTDVDASDLWDLQLDTQAWAMELFGRLLSVKVYGYYRTYYDPPSDFNEEVLSGGLRLGNKIFLKPDSLTFTPASGRVAENMGGGGFCCNRKFAWVLSHLASEGVGAGAYSPLPLYNSQVWKPDTPSNPYHRLTMYVTTTDGFDASYYNAYILGGELYEGDWYDGIISHSSGWSDFSLTNRTPLDSFVLTHKSGGDWSVTVTSGYSGYLSSSQYIPQIINIDYSSVSGDVYAIPVDSVFRRSLRSRVSGNIPSIIEKIPGAFNLVYGSRGAASGGVILETEEGSPLETEENEELTS